MFKKLLLPLLLMVSLCAQAQYTELIHPQEPKLAALYKKNHVRILRRLIKEHGNFIIKSISGVDTSGYALINQEMPRDKQYFEYDNEHRLLNRLDSFYFNKKFFSRLYSFTYYPNGLLSSIIMPEGKGSLVYKPAKKELEEKYQTLHAKEFLTNIYRYNDALQLVYEEYRDSIGRPTADHSYSYNSEGKLMQEKKNEYLPGNVKNFTAISYQYDNSGKPTGKQLNYIFNYGTADEVTGKKHTPQYSTQEEAYYYNEKGQLIKTAYTFPDKKSTNYIVEYEYYDTGLLAVDRTSLQSGKIQSTNMYTYEFWK